MPETTLKGESQASGDECQEVKRRTAKRVILEDSDEEVASTRNKMKRLRPESDSNSRKQDVSSQPRKMAKMESQKSPVRAPSPTKQKLPKANQSEKTSRSPSKQSPIARPTSQIVQDVEMIDEADLQDALMS